MRRACAWLVLSFAASTPAGAGSPYVALSAGAAFGESEVQTCECLEADFRNPAPAVDLAAGWDFGWLRFEAQVGFSRFETGRLAGSSIDTNGSVQLWRGLANAIVDLPLHEWVAWPLTLSLGGGVGAAYADMHDFVTTNGNDVGLAWNAQAVLSYALRPGIELGLGYRFLQVRDIGDAGEAPGEPDTRADLGSHDVLLVLSYRFSGGPQGSAEPHER